MKKIHTFHNPKNSSDYYRTTLPSQYCISNNWQIDVHDHLLNSHIDEYDAFIFKRTPRFDYLDIIKELKDKGKRVAWELDEDLWNIPSSFPFTLDLDIIKDLNACLDLCDIIIVSTNNLANILNRPNVRVCPSLIEPIPHKTKPKKNRIVWAGSLLNYENLLTIVDSVKRLIPKHKELEFIFFGDLPETFCKYIRIAGTLTGQITPCHPRVGFVPPVALDNYYKVLENLEGSIGIVPLQRNNYNQSLSNVKWLEYSMMDMATVASNIGEYSEIEGCKVSLDYEWDEAITDLLKNEDKRAEMARRAKEKVLEEYSWDSPKKKTWEKMFGELLDI